MALSSNICLRKFYGEMYDRPNWAGAGSNAVMNTRPGNILYGAGLAGAAISSLYSIDAIWVHSTGQSLLPISGRFVSREDMLAAISIGLVSALLCWGAGSMARYLLNRTATKASNICSFFIV